MNIILNRLLFSISYIILLSVYDQNNNLFASDDRREQKNSFIIKNDLEEEIDSYFKLLQNSFLFYITQKQDDKVIEIINKGLILNFKCDSFDFDDEVTILNLAFHNCKKQTLCKIVKLVQYDDGYEDLYSDLLLAIRFNNKYVIDILLKRYPYYIINLFEMAAGYKNMKFINTILPMIKNDQDTFYEIHNYLNDLLSSYLRNKNILMRTTLRKLWVGVENMLAKKNKKEKNFLLNMLKWSIKKNNTLFFKLFYLNEKAVRKNTHFLWSLYIFSFRNNAKKYMELLFPMLDTSNPYICISDLFKSYNKGNELQNRELLKLLKNGVKILNKKSPFLRYFFFQCLEYKSGYDKYDIDLVKHLLKADLDVNFIHNERICINCFLCGYSHMSTYSNPDLNDANSPCSEVNTPLQYLIILLSSCNRGLKESVVEIIELILNKLKEDIIGIKRTFMLAIFNKSIEITKMLINKTVTRNRLECDFLLYLSLKELSDTKFDLFFDEIKNIKKNQKLQQHKKCEKCEKCNLCVEREELEKENKDFKENAYRKFETACYNKDLDNIYKLILYDFINIRKNKFAIKKVVEIALKKFDIGTIMLLIDKKILTKNFTFLNGDKPIEIALQKKLMEEIYEDLFPSKDLMPYNMTKIVKNLLKLNPYTINLISKKHLKDLLYAIIRYDDIEMFQMIFDNSGENYFDTITYNSIYYGKIKPTQLILYLTNGEIRKYFYKKLIYKNRITFSYLLKQKCILYSLHNYLVTYSKDLYYNSPKINHLYTCSVLQSKTKMNAPSLKLYNYFLGKDRNGYRKTVFKLTNISDDPTIDEINDKELEKLVFSRQEYMQSIRLAYGLITNSVKSFSESGLLLEKIILNNILKNPDNDKIKKSEEEVKEINYILIVMHILFQYLFSIRLIPSKNERNY